MANPLTYAAYLQSAAWLQRRAHLLLSRGSRCERCGQVGPVDVHHTPEGYQHLGEETPDMLILLCRACHRLAHGLSATESTDERFERLVLLRGDADEHSDAGRSV